MPKISLTYELKCDENGNLQFRDNEVVDLTGGVIVSAGTFLPNMERDVQVEVDDVEQATEALTQAGFNCE